jgi:endonuclease/exonuclease/phosphatase family metal-dependent hydrolase
VSTSTIRVATLNCRNVVDRWRKRAPLLIGQLVDLNPDVIGLQELRHFPSQAGLIANKVGVGTAHAHWLHMTYKTGWMWFWEGIGILSRLPIVERDGLRLSGQNRVANFVRLRLPGGGVLDVYNTHLATGGRELKKAQVETILQWMAGRPGTPQVLVGDFNASPTSPTLQRAYQSLRSAYSVANGAEPARTVPTPLRRDADASSGVVMDYILVNDARVTFDKASPDDPSVYASDHFGLAATISVR